MTRIGSFCLVNKIPTHPHCFTYYLTSPKETKRFAAVDFGREDKEGLHLVLGHYLGALSGGQDDRAVLLYSWHVVLARRGQLKDEKASAAKKPFPVPPDLSPLFNACAILLNQRVLLASEGLCIEEFYQASSSPAAADGASN